MTIFQPFTVICVDDKNKPNDIPFDCWIVKNELYTCIEIIKLSNSFTLKLKEIKLPIYSKYIGYNIERFAKLHKQNMKINISHIDFDEYLVDINMIVITYPNGTFINLN